MKKSLFIMVCVLLCMIAFTGSVFAADIDALPQTISSDTSYDTGVSESNISSETDITAKGTCGASAADDVSWSLSKDGVLTISGTGAMANYSSSTLAPWMADGNNTKIKSVVVEKGVTAIGNYAFYQKSSVKCINIANVSIADTVERIGGRAFRNCEGLTAVVLPKGVTEIGAYAFYGCPNLVSVTIPDSVTNIGQQAFVSCVKLESVVLPSSVTTMGANAFQKCTGLVSAEINAAVLGATAFNGCTALSSVTFGDTVTNIGASAFLGCTSLKEVTIPASVTTVGASAFSGCTALESAVVNCSTLGNNAFQNCSALKTVSIGADVASLTSAMFSGCTALSSLIVDENNENLNVKDGVVYSTDGKTLMFCIPGKTGEFVVPETVEAIAGRAFSGCANLTSITIPKTITKIEGSTFSYCASLKEMDLSHCTEIGAYMFVGCTSLEKVLLPASITEIGNNFFYSCSGLKEFTIPESVTKIADGAFNGCSGLTSITIPESVTTVGIQAFEDCTSLTEVTFNGPNANGYIMFNNCTALKKLTLGSKVENFNASSFSGCTALSEIIVDANNGKFMAENGSLYAKGENKKELVFWGGTKKGEVTLPEGITAIGPSVFENCAELTKVNIPSTVTSIGEYAFRYCTELKEISFPENLTTLGNGVFQECTALTSLDIPDKVTSIGFNLFRDCRALETVTLPSGLTSMGSAIFQYCSKLKSVEIPDGVKEIPNYCFDSTESLEHLVLPAGITYIGYSNLQKHSLDYLYFKGTKEQWDAISPNYVVSSSYLKNTEIIYNYKGLGEESNAPVFTKQPGGTSVRHESGTFVKLSATVKEPAEGETLYFNWFQNSENSTVGGTRLTAVETEGATSTVTPDSATIGTSYYYCVVTKIDANGLMTTAASEPAKFVVLANFSGTGSASDPHIINDLADLERLNDYVAAGQTMEGVYFKLTADVELTKDWTPIGALKPKATSANNGVNIYPFSGVFNGGNHQITVAKGGQPLFGYVREAAVMNLDIYGEYINGNGLVANYVVDYGTDGNYNTGEGGSYQRGCPDTIDITNVTIKEGTVIRGSGFISGYASGGNTVQIINCTVEKGVKVGCNEDGTSAESSDVGSFAGEFNGMVVNSVSYADVYGVDHVGGLVGGKGQAMGYCRILNSSFHGTVNAKGNHVGGIIGMGYDGGESAPNACVVSIQNSYVDGSVSGNDYVGGIFGSDPKINQCWENGSSYITDNHFAGTLTHDENAAYVGGIVGYINSLNVYNIIENNYYISTCGADKGIGAVKYVDTSANGTAVEGTTYFNTGKVLPGINGVTNMKHNRSDDPLGADADKLTKAMTADQFKDGTVAAALNGGNYSLKNWISGKSYPEHSNEDIAYELSVSGEYKTNYFIGEELDLSGMILTASWTNNTTTNVNLDDVIISGYDKNIHGYQTVTVAYGSAKTEITVLVLKPDANMITVYFTMYGDSEHGAPTGDEDTHTHAKKNLELWTERTAYIIDQNATVWDLLQAVAEKNDMVLGNPIGNYVDRITYKGLTLAEFTNGTNSGWMYTLNGVHSDLGVAQQFLNNGDEIIWHYTDDYTIEYYGNQNDLDAAIVVMEKITAIGEVTTESGDVIEAARSAYDALSDAQKVLVENYGELTDAEKIYAELTKSEEPMDPENPVDPADPAPVELPFTDIDGHWGYNAIAYVYENEIMNGMTTTTFEPETTLSRAMFITMLYRMDGETAVDGSVIYNDVAANEWYTNAVIWGTKNGIINGYGDGTFNPNGLVTRQEMAKMMYCYAQYKCADVSATSTFDAFKDGTTVGEWAATYMGWAVAEGLMKGDTEGNLNPIGNAKRVEAATVIMRLADVVK